MEGIRRIGWLEYSISGDFTKDLRLFFEEALNTAWRSNSGIRILDCSDPAWGANFPWQVVVHITVTQYYIDVRVSPPHDER